MLVCKWGVYLGTSYRAVGRRGWDDDIPCYLEVEVVRIWVIGYGDVGGDGGKSDASISGLGEKVR